jgi:hypothetical protein
MAWTVHGTDRCASHTPSVIARKVYRRDKSRARLAAVQEQEQMREAARALIGLEFRRVV